jgi:hypothetical protein
VSVSDVELDRVLNALTTTFNDQHPDRLDPARIERIATGSLGGERKIEARAAGIWLATLHGAGDGARLATLKRSPKGKWSASRAQNAKGSNVAVP